MAGAAEAELHQIYELVGGYPLALKLVIGQMAIKPLPFVLESLKQMQPKNIADNYTYIYWQSWQSLSETGRRTLLALPLADSGSIDQLLALTELDPDRLEAMLEQWIRLALVQIQGEPEIHRYGVYSLIIAFLLHEVIEGWVGASLNQQIQKEKICLEEIEAVISPNNGVRWLDINLTEHSLSVVKPIVV